ncbi:MAG: glycosyl transferase group 1 [Frankiales bacterium]|nr:glycosyl transferase group 1 [Frankiales bacterium]
MTGPTFALYTPVLRSSHLERLAPLPGFRLLASGRHPDCDDAVLRAAPFPVLLADPDALAADLKADPPDVLEVTEPLWTAEWPASLRLADAVPDALLCTYAIEVLPHPAPPGWERLVAVAFGSAAAARAYDRSCPGAGWTTTVVEERRPRCGRCFPGDDDVVAASGELVFAAELSERKGVDLLLAAWDEVRPAGWRLRVLGWGPRTEQVRAWAQGRDDVDLLVQADRAQVHDAMRRAAAVVLPSRRVEGWREQIGLSLVEGLAHGCRLLTTDETGLAEGLGGEHVVVAAGSGPALADGLRALGEPASTKRLPGREDDSRQQVQRWLAGQVR